MKIIRIIFAFTLAIIVKSGIGQQIQYTVENAHSHNDYKQLVPFYTAYNAGFGSIEADVYLQNGLLPVAHAEEEIVPEKNLAAMYLKPLDSCIRKNNGFPYADKNKKLQLLIELKSEPVNELLVIEKELYKYPTIKNNPMIKIVFTGKTPPDSIIKNSPGYVYFDVAPNRKYNSSLLKKIEMFSDDFEHYTKWAGVGEIPDTAFIKLKAVVEKYHRLHKKVRFWDTPDDETTWKLMEKLQADYINTDKIRLLADFLQSSKS